MIHLQGSVYATLEGMDLIVLVSIFFLEIKHIIFLIFVQVEFDCPADGSCSNQGRCDDTIGICICDQGFEGSSCQGNFTCINSITNI